MALDDRERNFEKAVGRELRADALNGLHCPDAETLAAYHERMLSPEEMVAQKSHIAGCARCQEILGTLELTEAVPISERDSEEAVAPVSRRVQLEAAAAPMASAAASGAKRGSITSISKRRAYLRWVAPAGAIAAGLLVWVAIRGNRAPMMSRSKPVEVAENRDSGKADLGLPQPERREALPRSSSADKPTSKLQDNERQELDALVPGDRSKSIKRGRAGSGTGDGRGPSLTQNQIQNSIQNNGQNTAQNQTSREFDYRVDNKNADKKVSELPLAGGNVVGAMRAENAPRPSEPATRAKAAAAAPAPAPPAVPKQSYGEGAGAAAGAKTKSPDANAGKDEAVKSMTEAVEVTAAAPTVERAQKEAGNEKSALKKSKTEDALHMIVAGNLRDSDAGGLSMIMTPDPKVFWIVSVNGTVLKTEDGEKTFWQQKIGEGIKVMGGSAVDKKICWLIAEKGIVLRTTDGGKNWNRLAAAGGANFTTIKAASAMAATISDVTGSVSFSTADGGATWTQAAQPQPR